MTMQTLAVRYATASAYTEYLAQTMEPYLAVIDEADAWRVKASRADRVAFHTLTAAASEVVRQTCELASAMASHPIGKVGDYDGYNVNCVRVCLDDAVGAMLAADLTEADRLLGKTVEQFESILNRKRESVSPNRRITTMQRQVVTRLRNETEALRLELVRVMARVSELA